MKAIGPNIIPLIGNTYIHIKTGNRYVVLGIGKMKHPERGYWIDSVTYKREDIASSYYTRELHSFQIHFADADGIVEV